MTPSYHRNTHVLTDLLALCRQLNMYNFSKTRHDSNYREFRQNLFRRDRKDLLSLIKRKSQQNSSITSTPTNPADEDWHMQTDMDCHVASTDLCNLANQAVVKDEQCSSDLNSVHELKGLVLQLQQQVSYLQFQYDNLLVKHNDLNQFVRANMAQLSMESCQYEDASVSHPQLVQQQAQQYAQQQAQQHAMQQAQQYVQQHMRQQSPTLYGGGPRNFRSVYPPNPYMNHDVKVSIPVNVNIMCPAKISPSDPDAAAVKRGRSKCESTHEELVQTTASLAGKPLQRMPASWPLPNVNDSTTQEVETAKALVSMVSVDSAYN